MSNSADFLTFDQINARETQVNLDRERRREGDDQQDNRRQDPPDFDDVVGDDEADNIDFDALFADDDNDDTDQQNRNQQRDEDRQDQSNQEDPVDTYINGLDILGGTNARFSDNDMQAISQGDYTPIQNMVATMVRAGIKSAFRMNQQVVGERLNMLREQVLQQSAETIDTSTARRAMFRELRYIQGGPFEQSAIHALDKALKKYDLPQAINVVDAYMKKHMRSALGANNHQGGPGSRGARDQQQRSRSERQSSRNSGEQDWADVLG